MHLLQPLAGSRVLGHVTITNCMMVVVLMVEPSQAGAHGAHDGMVVLLFGFYLT